MSHPSKVKGSAFERECVEEAQALGMEAKRAWGSNGQSLGKPEEVDIIVQRTDIQCKRRAKLASFLIPSEDVTAVLARADHGEAIAILRRSDFYKMLKVYRESHPI